jgi:hypothetical protein
MGPHRLGVCAAGDPFFESLRKPSREHLVPRRDSQFKENYSTEIIDLRKLLNRNVQWFRGGLVCKAHDFCITELKAREQLSSRRRIEDFG